MKKALTLILVNLVLLSCSEKKPTVDSQVLKDADIAPEEKIIGVKEVFDEVGVREITEAKIKGYFEMALGELAKITVREERKATLQQFAEELMKRNR